MIARLKLRLQYLWVWLLTRPLTVRLLRQYLRGTDTPPPGPFDPEQVHRILVHRVDALGDTILTLPLLQALRDRWPNAHITYAAPPLALSLFKHDPRVNELLPVHTSRPFSRIRRMLEWRDICNAAGPQGYDLAIVARWDQDDYGCAIQCHLLGSRWIIGHEQSVRPNPLWIGARIDYLLTTAVKNATGHEVERTHALLEAIGLRAPAHVAPIGTTPAIETAIDHWLEIQSVPAGAPLIAFGVGSAEAKKIWPREHFATLAQSLLQQHFTLLIIGGPEDQDTGQYLAQHGCLDATRLPSIQHTAALLKRATLLIGNDSGPKHLAAAQGLPVIEISHHPEGADPEHRYSARRFGPWAVPHRVLSPRATTGTIADITPHEVLQAMQALSPSPART